LEIKEVECEKTFNTHDEVSGIQTDWDEVYYATFSGDLNQMLNVTELKTSLINRHFLLQTIVSESYKLRKEEKYKNICINFSEKYIEEFLQFLQPLKTEFGENLPRISIFKNYSTLLTELGEYEKAIKTCEFAISYNLKDGTKGGFEDRIMRINKKMLFSK
jgi:hypothetical protein